MNRREILKRSVLFSLAAGVASATKSGSTDTPAAKPKPLPVPAKDSLPVAFVIAKYAEVLDFAGPLEVFAGAATSDGRQLFSPYMVAATKDPVTVGGAMKVLPDYTFKTAPAPKVIVIPALDMTDTGPEMYDWIRSASKSTDITMSVCNGAFVLAKSGLLAGKSATCHHGGFFRFAATYPDVHLRRGARFVEEGNLASSGGISAGIDLSLRVVERYLGRDAAVDLADAMEYQGKGWFNPDSNDAYAKLPDFNESHPLCPVCLSDADRAIKSDYRGKTYYFCSKGEKELFEKNHDVFDRFVSEDAALLGKPSH